MVGLPAARERAERERGEGEERESEKERRGRAERESGEGERRGRAERVRIWVDPQTGTEDRILRLGLRAGYAHKHARN